MKRILIATVLGCIGGTGGALIASQFQQQQNVLQAAKTQEILAQNQKILANKEFSKKAQEATERINNINTEIATLRAENKAILEKYNKVIEIQDSIKRIDKNTESGVKQLQQDAIDRQNKEYRENLIQEQKSRLAREKFLSDLKLRNADLKSALDLAKSRNLSNPMSPETNPE